MSSIDFEIACISAGCYIILLSLYYFTLKSLKLTYTIIYFISLKLSLNIYIYNYIIIHFIQMISFFYLYSNDIYAIHSNCPSHYCIKALKIASCLKNCLFFICLLLLLLSLYFFFLTNIVIIHFFVNLSMNQKYSTKYFWPLLNFYQQRVIEKIY